MSSRVEEILNGTYEGKPQSRIEALLAGGAGSGGSGLSQAQVNNIVDTKIEEALNNLPPSGLSQDQVNSIVDAKIEEALDDLPSGGGNQLIIQPKKTVLLDQLTPFSSVGTVINLNQSIKEFDLIQIFAHMLYNTEHINGMVNEYYTNAIDYGNSNSSYSIVTLGSGTQGQSAFYVSADGTQLTSRGGDQCEIDKIVGIKNPSFFDESLLPVQDGLIRWYDAINNTGTGAHDNAASTWKDLTGNRDATVSNNSAWGEKSIYPKYSAINDNTFIYNNPTNSISLEMYLTIHTASGWQTLFDLAQGGGIFIGIENGVLKAGIHDGSNYHRLLYTIPSFMSKIHMIFTLDINSKVEILYVNGQKIEEANLSNLRYSTNILNIGRDGGTADIMNDGFIHDVRIYDKVLTPEEVQHNYVYSSQRYSNQPKIKIVNPPTIQKSEWDLLSLQEKKSHGLTIIQDSDAGYKRGILVNGADYEPDPPQLALIDAFTVNTNAKTIVVPDDGMYLVSAACPYNSNHSVTLPQNAEILSQVDKSLNNTHLYAYIVRLAKYDVVKFNIQPDQWTGRSAAVIKLEGINDVLLLSSEFTIGSGTVTYSLPDDNHYYLVYGVGIDRFAGRDDSTNVGSNELACVMGNWGTTSANRVTVCKGSVSPNFSFYGYDGGFAAIIPWMISTDMIDDPGIEPDPEPVEIVGDSTEENTEPLE